jgi:hypothetical protein
MKSPLKTFGLSILVVLSFGVLAAESMATSAWAAKDWTSRLSALDPARPLEYFELGEEMADAATTDQQRAIARRLFGIAGRIDPEGLGGSAALALATLTTDVRAADRLRAAAAMLGDGITRSGATRNRTRVDALTAIEISEAFGGFRTGRTSKLRQLVDDPIRLRLLKTWDDSLPGGVKWLAEQSRRSARSRPDLDEDEVLAMLRIEAGLLQGDQLTWSSMLDLDGDEPLLEIRVDRIDEMLLDGELLPYWRGGQWTATPRG